MVSMSRARCELTVAAWESPDAKNRGDIGVGDENNECAGAPLEGYNPDAKEAGICMLLLYSPRCADCGEDGDCDDGGNDRDGSMWRF